MLRWRGSGCVDGRFLLASSASFLAASSSSFFLRSSTSASFFLFKAASLSFRLRSSNSLKIALSLDLASSSRTTLSSSPGTVWILSVDPCPLLFPPCSFSTQSFASSCVENLIYTIPNALPVVLSISGSNETIRPWTAKCRRIWWFGVSGEILTTKIAVGGGGPTEY